MINANDTIKVYGKDYVVVRICTVDAIKSAALRSDLKHNGCIARATIRLPRGKKVVNLVNIYSNGDIETVYD